MVIKKSELSDRCEMDEIPNVRDEKLWGNEFYLLWNSPVLNNFQAKLRLVPWLGLINTALSSGNAFPHIVRKLGVLLKAERSTKDDVKRLSLLWKWSNEISSSERETLFGSKLLRKK